MISLPKPRGFWDYALSALVMTGVLVLLFWLEASDGISWTDAALDFADITSKRIRDDAVLAEVLTAGMFWSLRR
jgi:hypothetical protein